MASDNKSTLRAHVAMTMTMILFGLMAPFSKDALGSGLTGPQLATLRIGGGTVLFWLASLVMPWHHVPRRDLALMAVARLDSSWASVARRPSTPPWKSRPNPSMC